MVNQHLLVQMMCTHVHFCVNVATPLNALNGKNMLYYKNADL